MTTTANVMSLSSTGVDHRPGYVLAESESHAFGWCRPEAKPAGVSELHPATFVVALSPERRREVFLHTLWG